MTEYDATAASLRQAVKMDAIGQLTGGVAHDFNNILMVIMANLDALDEETDLDHAHAQPHRAHRQRHAARAAISPASCSPSRGDRRCSRSPPTSTSWSTALSGLLRRTLGEMVEVETVLGRWPVGRRYRSRPARGVAGQPRHQRARRACRTAAACALSPATCRCRPVRRADGIAAGDFVVVLVSDTGKGMPPTVLEKVVRAVLHHQGGGQGTGLGLSMVYGFLQQSKGHVRIESEAGRGTTVRSTCPGAARRRQSDGGRRRAADMERGTERILVVEDDLRVRTGVLRASWRAWATRSRAQRRRRSTGLAAFEARATAVRPAADRCDRSGGR